MADKTIADINNLLATKSVRGSASGNAGVKTLADVKNAFYNVPVAQLPQRYNSPMATSALSKSRIGDNTAVAERARNRYSARKYIELASTLPTYQANIDNAAPHYFTTSVDIQRLKTGAADPRAALAAPAQFAKAQGVGDKTKPADAEIFKNAKPVITADELATYNTLKQAGLVQEANSFLETLMPVIYDRERTHLIDEVKKQGTFETILTYATMGKMGFGSYLATAFTPESEINLNSRNYNMQAMREAAMEKLLIGAGEYEELAELGLMALDMVTSLGVSKAWVLANFASLASGQSIVDSLQRGSSKGQALLNGGVNAAIEVATEMIGLKFLWKAFDPLKDLAKKAGAEKITKGIVVNSVARFFENVGLNMAAQGGQEWLAEISQTFMDKLIMGDKSNYDLYKQYLIAQGHSEEAAKRMADNMYFVVQPLLAAKAGAIMGAAFGAPASFIGNVKVAREVKQWRNMLEGQGITDKATQTDIVHAVLKGNTMALHDAIANVGRQGVGTTAPVSASQPAREAAKTAGGTTTPPAKVSRPQAGQEWLGLLDKNKGLLSGANKTVVQAELKKFYNAGAGGTPINKVKPMLSATSGAPLLNRSVMDAAYTAGLKDATTQLPVEEAAAEKPVSYGEKGGLVRTPLVDTLAANGQADAESLQFLEMVGKTTGMMVEVVPHNSLTDSLGNYANAQYKNGIMSIDAALLSAEGFGGETAIVTAVHELVHRIRKASPEAYASLRKFVVGTMLEMEDTTGFTDNMKALAQAYNQGGELNLDDLVEEFVADFFANLPNMPQVIEQIASENPSLAKKILNWIRELIKKLLRIKEAAGENYANDFDLRIEQLQEAERLFADALKAASEATKKAGGKESGAAKNKLREEAPIEQGHTSAGTSRNQIAAIFKKDYVEWGKVNIDIGAGKADLATNYLADRGIISMPFDPSWRTEETNTAVVNYLKSGRKADTATIANVLNVIDSEKARVNVVLEAAKAVGDTGTAYFQIHEGNKSGKGAKTRDGWQNNRITADYMDEVETYFTDVNRRGNVIIAKAPVENLPQAMWEVAPGKAVKYSLRKDSEGNTLTEAQADFGYLKNDKGEVMRLYHGTSTYLKIEKFKTTEDYRTGLWLTTNKKTAESFAQFSTFPYDEKVSTFNKGNSEDVDGHKGVYELYAKVTNPLIADAHGKMYSDILVPDAMRGNAQPYTVSGEEIVQFAAENGYDGVVIKDVREVSGYRGDDVVVFNKNQVKYADNLNPTDNEDIRYSLRKGNELSRNLAAMKRESARLKEQLARAKEEMKLTKGKKADPKDIEKLAKRLAKTYHSTYPVAKLQSELQAYFDEISGSSAEDLSYEGIISNLKDIAYNIVNNAQILDNEQRKQYADLIYYLKTHAIKASEDYKHDVGAKEFVSFRERNKGRIKLRNKDGLAMDVMYETLKEEWPELFPEDLTNSVDQLLHVEQVLDGLAAEYVNPFSEEIDQATAWLAMELYEDYFAIRQRVTAADKAKAKAQAHEAKAVREATEKVVTKAQDALADQAVAYKAHYEDKILTAIIREVERREIAINKLTVKFEAKEAAAKEKQKVKVLQDKIKRAVKPLREMLSKPTKDRHIPEDLINAISKFMATINWNKGNGAITMSRVKLLELHNLYERLVKDNPGGLDLDEMLPDRMNVMLDAIKDTPVGQMNSTMLQELYNIIKELTFFVSIENRAFNEAITKTITELNEKAQAELANYKYKGHATEESARGEFTELFDWGTLRPEAAFGKFGDTYLGLYHELRKGFDETIRHIMEARIFASSLVHGLDLQDWGWYSGEFARQRAARKAIPLNLVNGKISLTPAEMMNLYMLGKRDKAKVHMLGKGIEMKRTGETIVLTELDIATIGAKLSHEQRRVAEALGTFLTENTARWGNEASMKLCGIKLFTEDDYWTIYVNKNAFDWTATEANKARATLRNSPRQKPATGDSKAIVMDNIFETFLAHVGFMANYGGMVVPLTDLQRLYNAPGMKDAMKKAVGPKGQNYFEQFLIDINNGGLTDRDSKFVERLLGWSKQAMVLANLSVVIQQISSLPRAVVGFDDPDKATLYIAAAIKNGVNRSQWTEVKKYAPVAQLKAMGYIDNFIGPSFRKIIFRETYRNSNLPRHGKFKDLTAIGMQEADKTAWLIIWQACEMDVKASTNLKPGTNEFKREVGARFTKVIDSTQVVDSKFHRSQIMRNKGFGWKMVTAFLSEPTLNYNIVYSATRDAALGRPEKSKKALATALRAAWTSGLIGAFGNAMLRVLWKMWRDKDDEEKEFWEESLYEFAAQTTGGLVLFTDVVSLFQGYEADRLDMAGISKFVLAINETGKYSRGESTKSGFKVFSDLLLTGASVVGIPATNIEREIRDIFRQYVEATPNLRDDYAYLMTAYDIHNEQSRHFFIDLLYDHPDSRDYNWLYKQLQADGVTEEQIKTRLRNVVKNKIDKLYEKKGKAGYQKMYDELIAEGITAQQIKDRFKYLDDKAKEKSPD